MRHEEIDMSRIYNDVSELIGHTPIVRLNKIKEIYKSGADLFAKVEYFNPASSAKDRVALNMIKDYEYKGLINKDTVIIEPTSGNTGIGLAMVCAEKGIRTIIVMPDSMSVERQKLMKAYGAELVLTPGALGMSGAIKTAEEIKEKTPGSIIAGQFVNASNPEAHYKTTGPEIYSDMDGAVDIFVAGIGTGGTISGTGKYLKEKNPSVKIIGVEPFSSPFLTKKTAGFHKIQGIGAGFVPDIYSADIVDEVITVKDEEAYEMASVLSRKEGLLVGISSGAALCGALNIAGRSENKGKNIVVLLPDTGEHYLSTDGFIK